MNISQIKQLQTVDGWVDFSAQIIEVKESKVRTQKNRLMQKVKLKDETDEIGAWLYADKQQFIPNQVVVASGMLKEYEGRRYIDYATVKSAQQAPQNTQQSTTQPTGRTSGKEKVDWDAIAEGKVRHGVLCAYLQGGVEPNYDSVLEHTKFIISGKIPQELGTVESRAKNHDQCAQEADDIPF